MEQYLTKMDSLGYVGVVIQDHEGKVMAALS